jgi:SAM-dependent methyltransferase
MKSIDLNQFQNYQRTYHDADPRPHGYSKYLDIRPWMADKLMHALYLGVDKSKPMTILDVGTGAGYFPYVCKYFGHQVVAIDLDVVPMYNDLCQFLQIDRRTWRIEKFQKLPDFGMKFDLISAFMIKFNNHYLKEQWKVDEWRFMIEDLKTSHLAPKGRIFLGFNANLDGSFYDDGLRRYFGDVGGRIWYNEVDIGGPRQNSLLDCLDRVLGAEIPSSYPSPR